MAAQAPASFAMEEKEPRITAGNSEIIRLPPHSSKVPFEAYLHYATIQRQKEDDMHTALSSTSEVGKLSRLRAIFTNEKDALPVETSVVQVQHDEKDEKSDGHSSPVSATRDERLQAQRAMRTATWISIFYLITTDILGPFSAPFAFSQLGFGSGVLLFFFLGIVAAYTGFLLWDMYLKLDSDEFPVKTYSDLVGRIFGRWARHAVNMLQSIQLIFNVGIIVLSNAQALAQVSKHRVCFSVLAVIWTIAGMIIGQIRSLQNYGGIAHFAIWLNLIVIFITMGAVAHSPPNFEAASQQLGLDPGPVVTQAFIQLPFSSQIIGVMQMVYSYGGAMLFIELMAEMKRPFDFWKGMICAQLVIVTVYLMFGAFVYGFQGQFAINPAYQGISAFGLQTATNVIAMVSALIAAGLYGNIGLKVIYVNIVQDLFNGPVMISRAGRIIWIVMVLMYWALAFIIASAVPQFSNISGKPIHPNFLTYTLLIFFLPRLTAIVAAICILQFTYTFPPIMYLGFTMRRDAIQGDAAYTPGAQASAFRTDSWRTWSRWWRGFSKRWHLNIFNLLLFLAAGATAGLGAFSSIEAIIDGFKLKGAATSFGCQAPV